MKPVDLSGNKTVSVKDMISGFGSGIGIVPLIIFIESIAVAKALSRKNNYKIDASQELVALGVGNVLASFFAAFPVTGSFSRSAVNSMSGARTPLSSKYLIIITVQGVPVSNLNISRNPYQKDINKVVLES